MIENKVDELPKNPFMINGPLLAHSIAFCVMTSIFAWAKFTGSGPDLFHSYNEPGVLFIWSGLCWPSRKFPFANRVPAYAATAVMLAAPFFIGSKIVQVILNGLAIALVIIGAILCHTEPSVVEG